MAYEVVLPERVQSEIKKCLKDKELVQRVYKRL